MPWSNQNGGGGWKGGGPWGQPPRGPSGGNQPPDLEELLRRSQEKLRDWLPGGGGSGGGLGGFGVKGVALAAVAAVALWAATGFYRVEPDELGVELILGRVTAQTTPGLNYNVPAPFGQVFTPKVLAVREISVGQRDWDTVRNIPGKDLPDESLMLTGDENMIDVSFKVQWNVKDARAFLFNIQNPEATVKAIAESAMREIVGKNSIELILTENQRRIETDVKNLMQHTLDAYKSGVEIRLVNMHKVNPPVQVIDSFRDVQAARIDAERLSNEAQTYANRIVPEARGQAAAVTAQAQAYRQRIVEEARGQADRFTKVLTEYRQAPDVTRERLYIETMERVFAGMDKVIVDQGKGEGAIQPYLPLDQLTRKAQPRTGGQP
ncbi:FtsH protease activity modulator HflK [Siculibacillus lacustris]|uniref:Protein HflK n=1 Tax=Siculibacillus lacustris TaxID=1549641 RepID=A0A4Q9VRU6_9HYPH|nr:FtsH protease activity modulator HflK [Siculibacillus lacustris]TBW38674.1 FtsH protease activity modulator HflK [Siculibacillus lacustris]